MHFYSLLQNGYTASDLARMQVCHAISALSAQLAEVKSRRSLCACSYTARSRAAEPQHDYGACMARVWHVYGTCMARAWHVYGTRILRTLNLLCRPQGYKDIEKAVKPPQLQLADSIKEGNVKGVDAAIEAVMTTPHHTTPHHTP